MVTSVTPVPEQQHMPRAQARAGGQDAHVRLDFVAYMDLSTSTTPLAKQTPDQSHVAARNRAGEYCCNQQYSVTAITTSTGVVSERYAYWAYGQPTILDASGSILSASAISNRYTYTGREWDATLGLNHFRARWMSPSAGRFLARDPIRRMRSNTYEFFDTCPVRYLDPIGSASISIRTGFSILQFSSFVAAFWPNTILQDSDPEPVPVDPIQHKDGYCMFKLGGSTSTDANWPPGIPIDVTNDPSVIPENMGNCCDILIFGHQHGSGGGTRSHSRDGWIDVLPSSDGVVEKNIKEKTQHCKKCRIFLYACGQIDKNAEDSDKAWKDFNDRRFKLAMDTGCDVYGLYGSYFITTEGADKLSWYSADCKKWVDSNANPKNVGRCRPAPLYKWQAPSR